MSKQILIAFAVLAIAFTLGFGCTSIQRNYTVQTAAITTDVMLLKAEYEDLEKSLREYQKTADMFTETEWARLEGVDTVLDKFILKLDDITEFNIAEITIADISYMYGLVGEAYAGGRQIIYKHWEALPRSAQIDLMLFDEKAQEVDIKLKELIENPENTSINDKVEMVTSMASIVFKLIRTATAIGVVDI